MALHNEVSGYLIKMIISENEHIMCTKVDWIPIGHIVC